MQIPQGRLLGGYGMEITDWSYLEGFVQGTVADDKFWTWVWAELHHQGDVGSATYFSAIELGSHFLKVEKPNGDYLCLLVCLGFPTKLHDSVDMHLDNYKYIRGKYLLHCVSNISMMDDLESVKLLLSAIAQDSQCFELAEYLDIIDCGEVEEIIKERKG